MASLSYPPNRLDNQSGVGMAWIPYNSYRLTLIYYKHILRNTPYFF